MFSRGSFMESSSGKKGIGKNSIQILQGSDSSRLQRPRNDVRKSNLLRSVKVKRDEIVRINEWDSPGERCETAPGPDETARLSRDGR